MLGRAGCWRQLVAGGSWLLAAAGLPLGSFWGGYSFGESGSPSQLRAS